MAAARKELELGATAIPSTVRMQAVRTAVMASRPSSQRPPARAPSGPPAPAKSPAARSVEMPEVPADLVVFPGERLARVDDFVRLRLHARTITFLGVLLREGLSPEYYAAMSDRFAEARRADPSLEARYRARLDLATSAARR